VKVEVAVLGSPSQINLMVSLDVKHHCPSLSMWSVLTVNVVNVSQLDPAAAAAAAAAVAAAAAAFCQYCYSNALFNIIF